MTKRLRYLLLRDSPLDRGLGLLRAHILPRFDAKTAEILLHEIDVLSEYQKRGIATALVEELKEIAVDMNASEIWVITNRSNQAAMRLYETTGARSPQSDDVVFIYDLDSEMDG
jgi:aminoglycoside 3-N-acetyltransferase I